MRDPKSRTHPVGAGSAHLRFLIDFLSRALKTVVVAIKYRCFCCLRGFGSVSISVAFVINRFVGCVGSNSTPSC